MNLHLGCGNQYLEGWVNYDLHSPVADVHGDARSLPYGNDSVDTILASHLLEHFNFKEAFDVLSEWRRVLKPGGLLIVEVPDLLEHAKLLVANPYDTSPAMPGIYGFPWFAGHAHQFGYTPPQLKWTLESVGFRDVQKKPETQYYKHLGALCMRFECRK